MMLKLKMHHYKLIITNDKIYPGTIQFHLAINTKFEHNLFRYQCLHEHQHLIDQHLINGRDQLSMSLHGHKHLIDQRLINGCDQLSMSLQGHKHLIGQRLINGRDHLSMFLHRHKHLIDQRLINGGDQLSMSLQALNQSTPNQWARSSINVLHGHKHATINAKPMGMILSLFIKTGNDYSLAVISMESLYQLMYMYMLKVKNNRLNYNSYIVAAIIRF